MNYNFGAKESTIAVLEETVTDNDTAFDGVRTCSIKDNEIAKTKSDKFTKEMIGNLDSGKNLTVKIKIMRTSVQVSLFDCIFMIVPPTLKESGRNIDKSLVFRKAIILMLTIQNR